MSDRDNSYSSGGSRSRENQLFVGRLPKNVEDDVVRDKFAHYGTLVRCDVKRGTKVAYAFVQYEDKKDAEDAMERENDTEMDGERIVIEWSRDSRGEGRGRGGYRGGGGGRGYRGGGGGRYNDNGYRGRDGGGDYRSSYRRDDYSRDDSGSRGKSYHDDDYHSSSSYRSRSQERH